jgi:quinol monooxygenase YgiN
MKNNEKYTILAKITILPGFEAGVKAAAKQVWKETSKESGCEMFLYNIESGTENIIYFLEVFLTREAFDVHLTLEHTKAFLDYIKGKVVGDFSERTFLDRIEE